MVLPEIGWKHRFTDVSKHWAGLRPRTEIVPCSGLGAPSMESLQIREMANARPAAPTRALLDRFFAQAIAQGGIDDGSPRIRAQYHPDFYGAYVGDPEGDKLCVYRHDPEQDTLSVAPGRAPVPPRPGPLACPTPPASLKLARAGHREGMIIETWGRPSVFNDPNPTRDANTGSAFWRDLSANS